MFPCLRQLTISRVPFPAQVHRMASERVVAKSSLLLPNIYPNNSLNPRVQGSVVVCTLRRRLLFDCACWLHDVYSFHVGLCRSGAAAQGVSEGVGLLVLFSSSYTRQPCAHGQLCVPVHILPQTSVTTLLVVLKLDGIVSADTPWTVVAIPALVLTAIEVTRALVGCIMACCHFREFSRFRRKHDSYLSSTQTGEWAPVCEEDLDNRSHQRAQEYFSAAKWMPTRAAGLQQAWMHACTHARTHMQCGGDSFRKRYALLREASGPAQVLYKPISMANAGARFLRRP